MKKILIPILTFTILLNQDLYSNPENSDLNNKTEVISEDNDSKDDEKPSILKEIATYAFIAVAAFSYGYILADLYYNPQGYALYDGNDKKEQVGRFYTLLYKLGFVKLKENEIIDLNYSDGNQRLIHNLARNSLYIWNNMTEEEKRKAVISPK